MTPTVGYKDPWDMSQWTIMEWAALAGLVASAAWAYQMLAKK